VHGLEGRKWTFRPPSGSRMTTILAPIGIFGVLGLVLLVGGVLGGAAGAVAGGLLIAIGVGLGIRNALVGITYSRDVVTVVNGFSTVRIPTRQVSEFRWTEQGLAVEWHDAAGRPRHTTVDAFHTARNPMAELARGQEVHRELEALHAGS
jgi:YD repeat-containing protein